VVSFPCSTEGKVSVGSWMQINRGFGVELGAIILQSSSHFMLSIEKLGEGQSIFSMQQTKHIINEILEQGITNDVCWKLMFFLV
jgi:hypothetical protein